MTPEPLPRTAFSEVRWADGRARAWNIATRDDGAGTLLWRVALAEIPLALPFTPFQGMERVFTVVAGRGVTLSFGKRRVEIAPDRPFRFDGDGPAPHCEPLSPDVIAFNVMAAKAGVRAEVVVQSGRVSVAAGPDEDVVALALDADATGDTPIPAGDAVRLPPGTGAVWRTDGRLIVARMARL